MLRCQRTVITTPPGLSLKHCFHIHFHSYLFIDCILASPSVRVFCLIFSCLLNNIVWVPVYIFIMLILLIVDFNEFIVMSVTDSCASNSLWCSGGQPCNNLYYVLIKPWVQWILGKISFYVDAFLILSDHYICLLNCPFLNILCS